MCWIVEVLSSPAVNVVRCSTIINPRSRIRGSVESNFLAGRRSFSRARREVTVKYFFVRSRGRRRCNSKASYDYWSHIPDDYFGLQVLWERKWDRRPWMVFEELRRRKVRACWHLRFCRKWKITSEWFIILVSIWQNLNFLIVINFVLQWSRFFYFVLFILIIIVRHLQLHLYFYISVDKILRANVKVAPKILIRNCMNKCATCRIGKVRWYARRYIL